MQCQNEMWEGSGEEPKGPDSSIDSGFLPWSQVHFHTTGLPGKSTSKKIYVPSLGLNLPRPLCFRQWWGGGTRTLTCPRKELIACPQITAGERRLISSHPSHKSHWESILSLPFGKLA